MMKAIMIVVALIMLAGSAQASKDLSMIINSFLCSDDPGVMAKMVEYPFRYTLNETDFIDKIKIIQKEDGIYKLGKTCDGFTWVVSQVSGKYQAASSDQKMVAYFVFNEYTNKIISIKGRVNIN